MVAAAALGMAPRSSSAVLVAISGSQESPRLLERRRIELVGSDLPAQAYHAAAELDLHQAEALIERWASAALAAASAAIGDVVTRAGAECHVSGVGIVGVVREVPALVTVLRSHPLLHIAEGQLAREALADAAARARLPVLYLAAKGPHDPVLGERAAELRHEAGVPWRKEHKLASIAALTALSAQ